jgi:hypothetical protein
MPLMIDKSSAVPQYARGRISILSCQPSDSRMRGIGAVHATRFALKVSQAGMLQDHGVLAWARVRHKQFVEQCSRSAFKHGYKGAEMQPK